MRTGRPKSALSINDEERAQLLSIARARSLPAALTQRARIVLACERKPSNKAVGAGLGVGVHTVGKWRNRFISHRLEGLYDELRSGRPRTIEGVSGILCAGAPWVTLRRGPHDAYQARTS
jgi:putative transposase